MSMYNVLAYKHEFVSYKYQHIFMYLVGSETWNIWSTVSGRKVNTLNMNEIPNEWHETLVIKKTVEHQTRQRG